MAEIGSDGIATRLTAKTGLPVGLNVTFRRNGVAQDPWAIRRVDIYKSSVKEDNLVAQILIPAPNATGYPSPIVLDPANPGSYILEFQVPDTLDAGVYFDVWRFIGSEPTCDVQDEEPLSLPYQVSSDCVVDLNNEERWISQCNKFWVSEDCWFLDDGLLTARFAFEPLDSRFRKGEIRNLEVGIMPLPLYDWDRNRFGQMIPQICPFITVETEECEIIEGLEKAPCRIGLRQGTYRTNPYVVQCPLDTSGFLKGQYRYRILLELPNGETRVSENFRFQIV
jgi:hypothetical protein